MTVAVAFRKLSITVGLSSVLSILGLALQTAAEATIVRINQSAFTPAAGLITFSEKPLGTQNPVYLPAEYGGAFGAPIVSFGGIFAGQTVGLPPIPPGAIASGVVNGAPNNPLGVVGTPATFIGNDGANPTSPVLSGSPIFNGPISILFSEDVAGVGLDGGFFNAIGGTAIKAFDRNGNLLGQVLNEATGIEFLGLVTGDGASRIAGLQFSLVGAEPAGFAIDNLRFGTTGQVIPPTEIPTPALLPGLVGMGLAVLRKRKDEENQATESAEI
ncbi:PTPA-CTERM sorting domain-containing protein [Leptolyngbya ohadii]|uniref:PTPA-CTERM sorting domain-containing protein n=1 Tax=Leptolyngbya ohadii TaxID=1962290 RepID=UPI00117B5B46|nr:PTPA-CTERM sorting domain-containing protein [Leptolyngbya ohadii]